MSSRIAYVVWQVVLAVALAIVSPELDFEFRPLIVLACFFACLVGLNPGVAVLVAAITAHYEMTSVGIAIMRPFGGLTGVVRSDFLARIPMDLVSYSAYSAFGALIGAVVLQMVRHRFGKDELVLGKQVWLQMKFTIAGTIAYLVVAGIGLAIALYIY